MVRTKKRKRAFSWCKYIYALACVRVRESVCACIHTCVSACTYVPVHILSVLWKNAQFSFLTSTCHRLRDMLRQEEQHYLAAMEAAEETTLERQARMRERAKSLKEKRESERLQIVQNKYDQQFRWELWQHLMFTFVCFQRMHVPVIKGTVSLP